MDHWAVPSPRAQPGGLAVGGQRQNDPRPIRQFGAAEGLIWKTRKQEKDGEHSRRGASEKTMETTNHAKEARMEKPARRRRSQASVSGGHSRQLPVPVSQLSTLNFQPFYLSALSCPEIIPPQENHGLREHRPKATSE